MMCRLGLSLLLVFTLQACSSGTKSATARSDAARASASPPNIVFVFADDHASHAISAYGSRINTTPNIDRLADEGMLFANCFVTNSICAPSRAVVLTGLFSHRNGVRTNADTFDGSLRTLPKILRKHGYQTALIGKWHLKSDPTGFDHWEVLIDQGPYYNPPLKTRDGTIKYEGYTTDIITDRAITWLSEREADRPFLLMYQHKAPHRNWQPGPDHFDLYADTTIPEPDTLFDDYSGRASPAAEQEMTLARHFFPADLKFRPPRNLTPEQLERWHAAYGPRNRAHDAADLSDREELRWRYQRYIKDYLRAVASIDDNLGRLLDWLERNDLAKNTVVIYSSDQGFFLGDHGWYDKRWMYEESARMPLLVRWPAAITPGAVNDELIMNVDFAPTMIDLAGASIPSEMQGRSFAPMFRGVDIADWRDAVYYHYYEYPQPHRVAPHYGIRTHRYKLIHYYTTDEWELFDLRNDPDELRSLYPDPAYKETVSRLKMRLRELQVEYGDSEAAQWLSRGSE